jgi:hypothetical protein
VALPVSGGVFLWVAARGTIQCTTVIRPQNPAKALGLTIPESFLLRADVTIE